MPAAAASEKEDYTCSGCFPFDSECESECKRDKSSGSKKDKKKKEKSSDRQKKEAAGGDTQCKDDKEARRVDTMDANRSSHGKLDRDSKEKLSKDKPGKDKKGKDTKDGKRKEWRGKGIEDNCKGKDTKLNAVYSCTEAKLAPQDANLCETDAKQKEKSCDEANAKQKGKLCKETEKQLKEIQKEIKQREKEAKRKERARSRSKDKKKCQKSSVKLGKFKCKNVKNPTLTQICNSAETNCRSCCELIGLYLKETYRFYTCVCSDQQAQATHFQETFCLLMKSLSCMCRDCYLLVRYICRLLFV